MKSNLTKILLLSFVLTPFMLAKAADVETGEISENGTAGEKPVEKSGSAENNPAENNAAGDESIRLIQRLMQTAKLGRSAEGKKISEEDALKFFRVAIQKALENNKDLKKERADIMRALGAYATARADFLPSVDAYADYAVKDSNDRFKVSPPDDVEKKTDTNSGAFSTGVQVSQNLFKGFGSVAGCKVAVNENKSKFEEYKALEGDILFRVLQSLLGIITQKMLLQENEANVAMHRELLKATVEKMKVGDIDRSEVAYAEAKCALSEAKLAAINVKLESLLSDFALWTGIPAGGVVLSHPNFSKFLPKTLEALKRHAEKNNHKILAGNYLAIAKKATIQKAASSGLPSVDFSMSAGLNDGTSRSNTPSSKEMLAEKTDTKAEYSVGVRLTVPLDIKGTARTAVGGARQDYIKTTIGGAQTLDSVMSDIETDFDRLKRENEIVNFYKRQMQACEIALQGTLQELAVGAKVYIQTLKAQSDLLEAQGHLAESRQERAETELRLMRSSGYLDSQTFQTIGFHFDPIGMYTLKPTQVEKKQVKAIQNPKTLVKTLPAPIQKVTPVQNPKALVKTLPAPIQKVAPKKPLVQKKVEVKPVAAPVVAKKDMKKA